MIFLLEKGLGKLGRWLRFLGYKVEFFRGEVNLSEAGDANKIVVTTSRRFADILSRKRLPFVLVPRDNWELQLYIVVNKFNLRTEPLLNICVYCGSNLIEVEKGEIADRIPPGVYEYGKDFTLCPGCGAVFWRGSHYSRIKEKLKHILKKYSYYNIRPWER